MRATGSGAAFRSIMSTGVVFGMTISTLIGLFLIPVRYVFMQKFSDGKTPKSAVLDANPDMQE
jgi:Cu/Ag efflux pump CusA